MRGIHFGCLPFLLLTYLSPFWFRNLEKNANDHYSCSFSCYPISGATYMEDGYFVQKVTSANVGAISVVFVLVLRLYSGWGYIGSRLVL